MHFYCDDMGRASMVSYNGTKYAYIHNLHGNIVGILDASDSLVENITMMHGVNRPPWQGRWVRSIPFRYRGYVWDEKTGCIIYPAVITILRLVGGLMRMVNFQRLAEIFVFIIYLLTASITLSTWTIQHDSGRM